VCEHACGLVVEHGPHASTEASNHDEICDEICDVYGGRSHLGSRLSVLRGLGLGWGLG